MKMKVFHLHSNIELLLPYIVNSILPVTSLFTFQYGATATLITLYSSKTTYKFTFQYGATATLITGTVYSFEKVFTFQYGATATFILTVII